METDTPLKTEIMSEKIKAVFDTVLKAARPIDRPEGKVIGEMIMRIILSMDAAGSGIMISYGSSFDNGLGILLLNDGEWTVVEKEDFKVFLLDFADRSDITLTDTFELSYNFLHRISPPQQCKNWPSMVKTAHLTMRKKK